MIPWAALMTDLLIILALILLNGVFAMAELAIASAKRLRLEESERNGSAGARVALDLADNPSTFLSTVQISITLISIFNGAFGEASLTARLAPWLAQVPALAPYAREAALAVVIAGITFMSLIFGELVPKSIAMQHPERVAMLVARPLRQLSRLMRPFVAVLAFSNDLIMRLLGLYERRDEAPTHQEISGMLECLRELLGTAVVFPDEAGGAYHTLAGFLLHQLGHIPRAAEHLEWNGYRFEVVDMDRHRIDRVLVAAL